MSERLFDWIFFDVGGPLVDDSSAVKQRRDIDLKVVQMYKPDITMQDILSLWPKACEMPGSIDKNIVRLFFDVSEVEEIHSVIQEEKQKAQSYLELLKPRTEMAEICKQLAQKYKLGIIANQHSLVKELLQQAGILEHFTHQKVSGDYGLEKPDPRFYEAVLEDTGADPNRSVMIDDNLVRSLLPASKFGLKTIWYKIEDFGRDVYQPDFEIEDLNQLLEIL